jgi:hypothetical protein
MSDDPSSMSHTAISITVQCIYAATESELSYERRWALLAASFAYSSSMDRPVWLVVSLLAHHRRDLWFIYAVWWHACSPHDVLLSEVEYKVSGFGTHVPVTISTFEYQTDPLRTHPKGWVDRQVSRTTKSPQIYRLPLKTHICSSEQFEWLRLINNEITTDMSFIIEKITLLNLRINLKNIIKHPRQI